MSKSPHLAPLVEKLKPGIRVIGVGILLFAIFRGVAPDNLFIAGAVLIGSHVAGLLLCAAGLLSWLRDAFQVWREPSPDRNFALTMRKAAAYQPGEESVEFAQAVEHAMRIQPELDDYECWSFNMFPPNEFGHTVVGYVAIGNGKVGMCLKYGVPGRWHESASVTARYDREGSVFTLRDCTGTFTGWGGEGDRLVFIRKAGCLPAIMLSATRLAPPVKSSLPAELEPLIG